MSFLNAPVDGGGLGGFLRRKMLATLVDKIETLTLAEFRTEDQAAGGVNLIVVRDRLGKGLEQRILGLLKSASQKTTLLLGFGMIAASCIAAFGIAQLQL